MPGVPRRSETSKEGGGQLEVFSSLQDAIHAAILCNDNTATLQQIHDVCWQLGRLACKKTGGWRWVSDDDNWKAQIRLILTTSDMFEECRTKDVAWSITPSHVGTMPMIVRVPANRYQPAPEKLPAALPSPYQSDVSPTGSGHTRSTGTAEDKLCGIHAGGVKPGAALPTPAQASAGAWRVQAVGSQQVTVHVPAGYSLPGQQSSLPFPVNVARRVPDGAFAAGAAHGQAHTVDGRQPACKRQVMGTTMQQAAAARQKRQRLDATAAAAGVPAPAAAEDIDDAAAQLMWLAKMARRGQKLQQQRQKERMKRKEKRAVDLGMATPLQQQLHTAHPAPVVNLQQEHGGQANAGHYAAGKRLSCDSGSASGDSHGAVLLPPSPELQPSRPQLCQQARRSQQPLGESGQAACHAVGQQPGATAANGMPLKYRILGRSPKRTDSDSEAREVHAPAPSTAASLKHSQPATPVASNPQLTQQRVQVHCVPAVAASALTLSYQLQQLPAPADVDAVLATRNMLQRLLSSKVAVGDVQPTHTQGISLQCHHPLAPALDLCRRSVK